MTDINKQIEEEARAIEYKQEIDLYEGLAGYEYACDLMELLKIEAYKNGYNKAKEEFEHSSHWRKVSEELPPIDTQVLVKTSNGKFSISTMYVPRDCNGNILGDIEWKCSSSFKSSIIEWKYID